MFVNFVGKGKPWISMFNKESVFYRNTDFGKQTKSTFHVYTICTHSTKKSLPQKIKVLYRLLDICLSIVEDCMLLSRCILSVVCVHQISGF